MPWQRCVAVSRFGCPTRTEPVNRSFGDVQVVDCSLQRFARFPYCRSRRLSGAVRCYEVVLESHLTADHVQMAATPCFEGVARLTNTDVQTFMHRDLIGISDEAPWLYVRTTATATPKAGVSM